MPFPHRELLKWFVHSKRALPWRESYDPYHVWVSEVMAQQTRMDQMLPYYEKFLTQFPTVRVLADADEEKVLKAWEGLGYYSRARNLQHAAKQIVYEKKGNIPRTKKELMELKGFGPYISSAVASIAFNANEVVVDGNVLRVMSRFWGDSRDVSLNQTKQSFEQKLVGILPNGKARDFNQALMELGALICTPDHPACEKCPLQTTCYAYAHGKQSDFPVKKKKSRVPHRHFAAVRIQDGSKLILFPRKERLLYGMYEFPMVEYAPLLDSPREIEKRFREKWNLVVRVEKSLRTASHQYSHFTQHVHLFEAVIDKKSEIKNWVEEKAVASLPLSKIQQKLME